MALQNQIATDHVDNQITFDKKIWDSMFPIQIVAHDAILQSPIVNVLGNCQLDGGGVYADTIFTSRLSGDPEELLPRTALNVSGASQFRDSCIAIYRGKTWGKEEIAKDMIGGDLLAEVFKATTQYWSDIYQKYILNMLRGVFDGTLKNTHQLDASNYSMCWDVVAAAKQQLGDKSKELGTIIMHSAQLSNLKKSGLVKYYNASELGYDIWTKGIIPTIDGLWIIETDTVPVTTVNGVKQYHAYIGGKGAIQFRNIQFNNKDYWDALGGGTNYFIQTTKVMLRVPGVKFVREQASDQMNFRNTDLINPLCWQKIAEDDKDILLVELITKADSLLPEPPVVEPEPPDNGGNGNGNGNGGG